MIVVPRAGTWIETSKKENDMAIKGSFPVRERGLKHGKRTESLARYAVVPRAGTWIETAS